MRKQMRDGESSGKMSRRMAADVLAFPHMYDNTTVKAAKAYIKKFGTEDKPKVHRK